jgi:hypothetical protein
VTDTAEHHRLADDRAGTAAWKRWGPYLSERQWGSVREDPSSTGDAWNALPHDHARSYAYQWGEDGLAGISDDRQIACLALALWNGRDPILKERMFGLTNTEGNHGEDAKEYWFYLDSTPTHSWMRWLYKYPQVEFPYARLVEENRSRTRDAMEYELLETGVFDDDRYFDVEVQYAKLSPDDVMMRVVVHNRGPEEAELHVLPTVWFRNQWDRPIRPREKPALHAIEGPPGTAAVSLHEVRLGELTAWFDGAPPLLFTENETNRERLYGEANRCPYVKDGIGEAVVHGRLDAVNPDGTGTKVAAHHLLRVPAGGQRDVWVRFAAAGAEAVTEPFGAEARAVFEQRRREADEFYDLITPDHLDAERRNVHRQALAGMLWSKQYYGYDVSRWLSERHAHPFQEGAGWARNQSWYHMAAHDVISMPDTWEYPWFAAWDLAFQCIPLALVDIDFAKAQLELLLNERYLHPNGQIPAYEWSFSDVNPPVHALAAMFVYRMERDLHGHADVEFLARVFHKLVTNFTWWVNRKDPTGRNVFEGGFLGLDNIGVFDRSSALPNGGRLEQADGTAWMALYAVTMLEIAAELSQNDPALEDMAVKFVEHFMWIAAALDRPGDVGDPWDDDDGFFYDVLVVPGGAMRVKVRSLVGLMPLAASTSVRSPDPDHVSQVRSRTRELVERNRDLFTRLHDPSVMGANDRHLFSPLDEPKLRRMLARLLDEDEFLSPYGVRSLSKAHERRPYRFDLDGQVSEVAYWPAESHSGMFGGNSNWRGPVWFPMNLLIIRALLHLDAYYGPDFTVELPTGSGRQATLGEVAEEIRDRLCRIFLPDADGRRPAFGGTAKFHTDPHWRDLLLFHEYFHGDDGAGLGASHQTGWTGLVATLLTGFHLFRGAANE